MTEDLPILQHKSLAQILYELNPSIGWSPAWDVLDGHQRRWGINYEQTARNFIIQETAIKDANKHSSATLTLPILFR